MSLVLGSLLRSCAVVLWGWAITAVMYGVFAVGTNIIISLQSSGFVSDTTVVGATLYLSCLSSGFVGVVGVATWYWLRDRRARAAALRDDQDGDQ